jgi:L-arabinose isomerase
VRFTSKPGPITYVNLVGRKGNYRLCALQGEALPTEMVFEGNPMKIALYAPLKEIWEVVDRFGFGHHWMAAYGHHVSVIAELCKLIGIIGVFPELDEIVGRR